MQSSTPRDTGDAAIAWWLEDNPELSVRADGLMMAGASISELAKRHGTPLYIYSASSIRSRLAALRAALAASEAPFKIYYAMKANRFAPVISTIRGEGDIGVDACSPREVELALSSGFSAAEISVTAGMLSNRDLDSLARHRVHLNLDTHSALRRWAALCGRGVKVGLRVDPAARLGWRSEDEVFSYGSSKFGFSFDEVARAADYARELGLEVDTLHFHAGWGIPESAAPALGEVYSRLAAVAKTIPGVRCLNIGGGLACRHFVDDAPLTLTTWSNLIRTHLTPTGCSVAIEPGTFVMAGSGVLVCEVNTVEARASGAWIGIDAGHNINVYATLYGLPLTLTAVAAPWGPLEGPVNVAGNINEAIDVFHRNAYIPRVREGDLVAFYPAGAYGSSMASDHCMRGFAAEVMV